MHDWIEIARILRVRDLYKLTGLPVGQLPDEPAEPEIIAPIRSAMIEWRPPSGEPPDLSALGRATDFAWSSWYGSGERYSRTGPMLPDLIVQSRMALATAGTGVARKMALRQVVEVYLLVRAFAKRTGAQDLAMLAADRAVAAAEAADDPHYRGIAAWHMAVVLGTKGWAEQSADLCRQAINALERVDDQDTTRMVIIGQLNLQLAVQEARVRGERPASLALDAAEQIACKVGETAHHHVYFGPINVGIHRGAVAVELSQSRAALHIAERIEVTRSPSVERRHTHYTHLAQSYAAEKQDLAAAMMLDRADREIPEEARMSLPFRAVVRDLLQRETPTTRPVLRPLAERVGIA